MSNAVQNKPILVIDGLNSFMRHYCANPTMSENGEPAGGFVGFIKSLGSLCNQFLPSQIVVVWESGGNQKRREISGGSYKDNRRPASLNRYYEDDIPNTRENHNRQISLTIEALKFLPVSQIYVKDTEADDIIAHAINHQRYKGWMKTIISSDKDFFQLCRDDVQIYRPIQNTLMTKNKVIEEFSIHPKNFALARAMAGDSSDNLPGIQGAGLKTIAKRFPYLIREDEYVVSDIIRDCAMQGKKLKLHENIESNEKLIKDNYAIMQLYHPNIRPLNRALVDKAIDDFEPYYDKIKFTQMLFHDSAGTLNFTDLQAVFHKIKR